jgi:lipid A ethanolaminephosphotransferase
MRSRLPAFNTIWVAALSAAFLLFLTNGVFWSKATAFFATNHPFLIGFTVSLYLLFFAVLLTLSAPYMLRPVYSLIFLIAAGAGYFTDTFGVMIDRDMIRNVAQTDVAESSQLMTSGYVIHMLLYGVLPCLLIWLIPIKRLRPLREVGRNTALILGSVVVAFGFILTHLVVFMPFWQREREVTMRFPARSTTGCGNISAALTWRLPTGPMPNLVPPSRTPRTRPSSFSWWAKPRAPRISA